MCIQLYGRQQPIQRLQWQLSWRVQVEIAPPERYHCMSIRVSNETGQDKIVSRCRSTNNKLQESRNQASPIRFPSGSVHTSGTSYCKETIQHGTILVIVIIPFEESLTRLSEANYSLPARGKRRGDVKRGLEYGYGLRCSTEIYGRKRFSWNTYRKLALFLPKSPETSGSLDVNTYIYIYIYTYI